MSQTDSSGHLNTISISEPEQEDSLGMNGRRRSTRAASEAAKLDVIIPPSIGHGFDIYQELGTDRVLVYARFDDSSQDFPIDTQFAQIGLLRNPTISESNTIFTDNTFTSVNSLKLLSFSGDLEVGDIIEQSTDEGTAKAYVTSLQRF